MKRKYSYRAGNKTIEREYNYIPVRYIIAVLISVLEIAAIIGIVILLCMYVRFFYLLCFVTAFGCILKIIASDDNPDYKVPWLFFVLTLPIVGFMLYFMFYSRKLKRRFVKRLGELSRYSYKQDSVEADRILARDPAAASQARMLCRLSGSHIFTDTKQTYFPLGEDMHAALLSDLERAERFIFMEYFIIEDGKFWGSVLNLLRRKVKEGITVRVIYDDIGCMNTLPGNYEKRLREYGIEAAIFSRLRGNADSSFNNRSHRKITVIDGKIGYTGGVNIADEYINEVVRFGHWKDTAIRLEGAAVRELTRLFLCDYGLNVKALPSDEIDYYPEPVRTEAGGCIIPFGDGPKPIFERRVGKSVIQNMLSAANDYVYMTSPYLIIDNELCTAIEGAALRGVDVRIIIPHIPDKKLVFEMSRSYYNRLMAAGVKIYEYKPGFIHAKSYVADGKYAMIGTINLDYRSLVHHFENGVWMYRCDSIADIKRDIDGVIAESIEVSPDMLRAGLLRRFIRAAVRIFSPML